MPVLFQFEPRAEFGVPGPGRALLATVWRRFNTAQTWSEYFVTILATTVIFEVVSAAIMAGFLHAADDKMRETINSELRWLYDNEVPSVPVQIPSKLCRLGSHVDLPANHSTTKK